MSQSAIVHDDKPVGGWVLEGPLPQSDAVERGRGFYVPGCRRRCDMKGYDDDWDSRSAASVTVSASSRASSPLGRIPHGVVASGSVAPREVRVKSVARWPKGEGVPCQQEGTQLHADMLVFASGHETERTMRDATGGATTFRGKGHLLVQGNPTGGPRMLPRHALLMDSGMRCGRTMLWILQITLQRHTLPLVAKQRLVRNGKLAYLYHFIKAIINHYLPNRTFTTFTP